MSKLVIDLSCRRQGDTWVVAMNKWQTLTDMEVTRGKAEVTLAGIPELMDVQILSSYWKSSVRNSLSMLQTTRVCSAASTRNWSGNWVNGAESLSPMQEEQRVSKTSRR